MTTPEMDNGYPDSFVQEPLTVSEKRSRVTYLSAPLPKDLKVVGGAQVKFYASIDYTNTTWRVSCASTAAGDGAARLGWLRAAHRAVDKERTTNLKWCTTIRRSAGRAGEICEYIVQLRPCAHIFRAGTQIELEISSIDIPTDPDTYDIMWHYCECETICHRIYRTQS
jgi:predicted acyl esterase